MKPWIGITCTRMQTSGQRGGSFVTDAYVSAVRHAGGIPILLPIVDEEELNRAWFDRIDGLLLSGGEDIDPRFFNEDPHPQLGQIVPERDRQEIWLSRWAISEDKPLLAICRGIQILNVALGGGMVQDIGSQVVQPIQHSQKAPFSHASHNIEIESGTKMENIAGGMATYVNSFHHQSVGEVAPGFVVSAWAGDGVTEAIESVDHPFAVGVQWHPEFLVQTEEHAKRLFKAFIESARKF